MSAGERVPPGGEPVVEGAEPAAAAEITALLQAANRGEDDARNRLVDLLYDELRWLAHRHLRRERGRPLATTELVHEAYLKLAGGRLPDESRRHFLGGASRAMRQVLVTEARRRDAIKRSPDGPLVTVETIGASADPVEEILSVSHALDVLATLDARLVQVVECRFFGGLSVEETALAMATSPRTVKRDWRRARAWLFARLGGGGVAGAEGAGPA